MSANENWYTHTSTGTELMPTFRSNGVSIRWDGIVRPADAELLIGKTIAGARSVEDTLTLSFSDGSSLTIAGSDSHSSPLSGAVDDDDEDILGLHSAEWQK